MPSNRPVCQYCQRVGHTARTCFKIHPELRANLIHPQANVTTSHGASSSAPPSWLLDSAASHHVTDNLGHLALSEKYDGPDTIAIGDGSAHGNSGASGTR
ncbi:unnamed protein product [Linum tenue]|uniref:Uncharacterized protein n=1 Tax=Linum tenue TaxID=586396 RepID=A0AAV0PPM6_9ROSI|nr:unnamed protein product [Linum tenue]